MPARVGVSFFIVVSLVCIGCSRDNATALADQLKEGASRLNSADTASATVSFAPLTGAPYTVVFFPNRRVAETELVAAGVSEAVADRIYKELGYLGPMERRLVVEQEGQRLAFTTSWRGSANVRDLVVLPRKTGPASIELTREDGTVRVVAIR